MEKEPTIQNKEILDSKKQEKQVDKEKILNDIFKQNNIKITPPSEEILGLPDDMKEKISVILSSISKEDIEKSLKEKAKFLENKENLDGSNIPNIKIKDIPESDLSINANVSIMTGYYGYSSLDANLYVAQNIESNKFGSLSFDIEDQYLNNDIEFFQKMEESQEIIVLEDAGAIGNYSLLKCNNKIIPVSKFLSIIDPGTEQDSNPYLWDNDYRKQLEKILKKYNLNAKYDYRDDVRGLSIVGKTRWKNKQEYEEYMKKTGK